MTCTKFSDIKNDWAKVKGNLYLNPKITPQQSYNQECTFWSSKIQERNSNNCSVLIKPTCTIQNMNLSSSHCPFGYFAENQKYGVTHEYCECLGLTKQKMNESHPFQCICTRNLEYEPLKLDEKDCNQNFLFTKNCTVSKVEQHHNTSTTDYNYTAQCNFVSCFDDPLMKLFEVTNFNTTCSNGTSQAQLSPPTIEPTTIRHIPTSTKNMSSHLIQESTNASMDAITPDILMINNGSEGALALGHKKHAKGLDGGSISALVIFAVFLQIIFLISVGYAIKKHKRGY